MKHDRILLAHGSGGLMSQRLIDEIFKKAFNNDIMEPMLDGAILDLPAGKLAMSTDSFVITPLFFPGGDIGKLSICGTVNDLLACGAQPLYLSTAFIIEEGLPISDLRSIVASMAETARQVGVKLVTGDTKVVEKGSADGVFINTTGIGIIPAGIDYLPQRINSGDKVIVTGNIGDHGLAILAQREGLSFSTPVLSDCAPLYQLKDMIDKYQDAIRCMRDPTRGGLATVLNEIAVQAGVGIRVKEADIPVSVAVQGACDMLGMDPLYMANEGKMVIFVAAEAAEDFLNDLHKMSQTENAALIGRVSPEPAGMVLVETELGAERILGVLEGEHIPRIC
ncbi:Hydrogenase expression/formation protein HypE [Syntrophomonas zehnderi OL-4]|uniref:Hydrogenase expression/formation protein HypE n=1 Tax=Syntrophomonas zehnderi OL-4 TaxID=690567 RepID=A0A0E4C862_9FIRM|nr:hydrogenase expression/formation protein HypE [Syntrophomonas zehnderi]CFX28392.1 Hydrogenase expression/formation protein HypE [Syntrophomonas zehnderi OL-4]